MGTVLRPVGHEDKLSLVEHLDELRTRILICLAVFVSAFAVCMWQDDKVLEIVNRPLAQVSREDRDDPLETRFEFDQKVQRLAQAIQADPGLSAKTREAAKEVAALVVAKEELKPITTKVGEPFFATFRVAAYAALLISLPLLLWQAYAFVLPAFSPSERKAAFPLMCMVPLLFYGGVVFGYFVVLPSAVDFLQNFNDDQFDILLQANDLYRFSSLALLAMGLLFQIPVVVLLLTRLKILSVKQLRANRRYAILVIAIAAMLLPGTDPVTMLIAMLPLLVLFEGSILLAAALERRESRAELEPTEPD